MLIFLGTTSVRRVVFVWNDAGTAGVTGLNAASFPSVYYYPASGAARVLITLSDRASVNVAFSEGSIFELGGGAYSFDFPDAMFAVAGDVTVSGDAAQKHLLYPPIEVTTEPRGTVIVTPVAGSITNPRWINRDWGDVWKGSAPSSTYSVVDSAGTPVDFTGKTLRFVAYSTDGKTLTPVFTRETGGNGITVGGTDHNQVTVALTTTNTAAAGTLYADLWNITDNLPIARGKLAIVPAAKTL